MRGSLAPTTGPGATELVLLCRVRTKVTCPRTTRSVSKSLNEAFGSGMMDDTRRHHVSFVQFVNLVSLLRRKTELSSIHRLIPAGSGGSHPFSEAQAQHR